MVRRYTSKPRNGGRHRVPKVKDVTVDSRPPIEDDSCKIAPGYRDAQARDVQFQAVSRDYFMTHIYGGRLHAPNYDNG